MVMRFRKKTWKELLEENNELREERAKLMWKNFGVGFFAGATAMAIISLLVITINLIQCLR